MKKLSSRRNFTLVELLIIIAVTSLLVLTALPVFGSAQGTAVASGCASNLKQIGIALEAYRTDNAGEQPINTVNWSRVGFNNSVVGLLAPYTKSGDHYREVPETHKTPWVCDADPNAESYYWNSSYGAVNLNLFPHIDTHFRLRVKYSAVKNPAAVFAIMDGQHNSRYPAVFVLSKKYVDFDTDCNGNGIKESYQKNKFNLADPRHADRINVLFVDGHSGPVDEPEFVKAEHWTLN